MNEFVLSINDYSSFIELYTGLLFAFSGIDRLRNFVEGRIKEQISNRYKELKEQIEKSGFIQIPILNPALLETDKVKKIYDWLKEIVENDPNTGVFESDFNKIKITASHIAIFGGTLLLQMGFTVNKNEFYLSYFSISLQELTYKVLLIYSIFVGLFIIVVFVFDKVATSFDTSTTNLFIKNFLISFVFFLLSLFICLILTLTARFFSYSNWIQNLSVFVSIFIFIVCYPIFIISSFTKTTVSIYHKFRLAEYYFLKDDIAIEPDIQVHRSLNGSYNISRFVKDALKMIFRLIKHQFSNLRPIFIFSFFKRFRIQSYILLIILVLTIVVISIFLYYRRTLDESITDLINKSNNKTFQILDNVHEYSDSDIKDELSKFYYINQPAFNKIDSIIRARRKDSLVLDEVSNMKIKFVGLTEDKVDYDTIYVKTDENWYVIWENQKTNVKIRYTSDTTKQQVYKLYKQPKGTWKIVSNIYFGNIDTLKIK